MSVKIEFRKDRKKYQVTFYIEGKRKRPLFQSKLEADSFARKVRLGLSPEAKDSITVAEAAQKYYEIASAKKCKKSQCNDKLYLNLFEHFLFTFRGLERVGSVQLEDMEAFRDWLPLQTEYDDRPMSWSHSTCNRCLAVIKHFFKRHIQWKSIRENPCFYLEKLDSEPKERPAMSFSQYGLTLTQAPAWFRPVLTFAYLTGAPPSCIERLTWDDIDLHQRVYFVLRKKGRGARWRRTRMSMGDEVFQLLVQLRNQSIHDGAVFRDGEGRRLLADRISRVGNAAIKAAGIHGVTLYCLRHALASDLTQANVATELVRQVMGHASIATTQRYANKVHLKSIAGAIDSVRGGSLVANGK